MTGRKLIRPLVSSTAGRTSSSESTQAWLPRPIRSRSRRLLVCPYCLGLWVTSSFAIGLVFAARVTRFLISIFSALTLSDFLQIAYKATEDKALD